MHEKPQVKASAITFNEGVLRIAAVHQRRVEFRYQKGGLASGGAIETRTFVPTRVFSTDEGNVVIQGPDPDRDDQTRNYRLDRIKGDVKIP